MTNRLYYGDNLDVLREHVGDASVDLVYLDPPFNSNASYNILFKSPTGQGADASIEAFDDTWAWGPTAEGALKPEKSLVSARKGLFGPKYLAGLSMRCLTARLLSVRSGWVPTWN